MNILEEIERRKPIYNKLIKKRRELRKELKQVEKEIETVNPDYFDIALKAIEEEYGCKTVEYGFKTTLVRYFDLYAANSTPKQIQYRRPEKVIGRMQVYDNHLCYDRPYGPDIITDLPKTTAQVKWLMTHYYTSYIQKLWDIHHRKEYTLKELVDFMLEEKRKQKNDNSN